MVAAEGIEPSFLDYRSSGLPLTYTALVDPARLKLALHGLKGRCSVTRAPDQEMAVAEGLEPSHGRINSAVPYQLGYATKTFMDAAARFELALSRLQDEYSGAN